MKKIEFIIVYFLFFTQLSFSQPIPFPDIIVPDYNNIKEFPKQSSQGQIPNEIVRVGNKTYNVDFSWKKAEIYTPENKSNQTKIEDIQSQKKYPTLILMHGCNGIKNTERHWSTLFNEMGFVTILPDSFAIPGRTSGCGSNYTISGNYEVINKIRRTEATYVIAKLQEKDWVDKNNIFIMGHSEGGNAMTFLTDERLKGIIFSGNPCKISYYMRNSKIPILAINWSNDPWVGSMGLCKDNWGDQVNATQIILEGSGHETSSNEIAQISVKNFIKKYIR